MVGANEPTILPRDCFDSLFDVLQRQGYICVGPTVRDGAIVYDQIHRAADLPQGWTDEQAPGHYRLRRRGDEALFGCVVGPHSWKTYLFPPEQRLWRLKRRGQGFERVDAEAGAPRYAFLGVRACEVAALQIQDRVFTGGRFTEPAYQHRREDALVIAVSCTRSAATCFCVSLKTGPDVTTGFDLSITEVLAGAHVFVVCAGTERGRAILEELPTRPATPADVQAANAAVERATRQQRALETEGLPELLRDRLDSPQWEEIAQRCLACANCTMACPTCFCSSVDELSDLTGEHAERWRRWDSCFNPDFSFVHAGETRKTTASRYRQWLTHKLGTWVDQFGSSGCVGCGRCITWCPVGIDLTEEVRQMRHGGRHEGIG